MIESSYPRFIPFSVNIFMSPRARTLPRVGPTSERSCQMYMRYAALHPHAPPVRGTKIHPHQSTSPKVCRVRGSFCVRIRIFLIGGGPWVSTSIRRLKLHHRTTFRAQFKIRQRSNQSEYLCFLTQAFQYEARSIVSGSMLAPWSPSSCRCCPHSQGQQPSTKRIRGSRWILVF